MTTEMGRLERVELRTIWSSEAGSFTPWLAGEVNLKLLGDTVGIELEFEAKEKDVGPFRADILCKDTASGAWVLIENQLERTDHTHLGQLLTYAAGLQAVTVIWIAERFTEEHRAALDWLNEITDDRFNFFGLEIELWRIGDSAVAPKFNVVCKPNDWSKTVTDAANRIVQGDLTEAKQTQLAFWAEFNQYANQHAKRIRPTKALPQHWMNIALGRSGFRLAAVASFWDSEAESYEGNELRVELVIDGPNAKQQYGMLEAQRSTIARELGQELKWYNPPEKKMCRVHVRRTAQLSARDRWPEYCDWLVRNLDAFHLAFAARVRNINVPISDENGEVGP